MDEPDNWLRLIFRGRFETKPISKNLQFKSDNTPLSRNIDMLNV